MGMENNDFRRRLLDQELPVDAGAFGRVMERRKAGGTGAAWIGKGIWAAALLVATAGIGLFVQRTPTAGNGQEGPGTPVATLVADPAVPMGGDASNTAAYPAASDATGRVASAAQGKTTSEAQRNLSSNQRRNTTGRSRNASAGAVSLVPAIPRRTGKPLAEVNTAGSHLGESNSREPSLAGYESWSALMRRPLQLQALFRSPKAPGALDMPRAERGGQRFVQTEWMAEPGWVFKQTPAGAALRRQERFAGAGAFTARLVFPANRGFQWVSGIRYQEWVDHFNFSQEHTATHQRIDAYDVIIRVPGQPDRTETRYDTTQMQVTRQESYQDINRYRMIGLPLAFRWSPVENGIWYVQAGITPSYMVYRGGSRRLNDGTVVSIAEGANINRFQLHAGFAAGMRRFIAPRVAMLLEPGLGYNLTPFAGGPLRQRNLQLSLSAGLMFHLGR